MAYSKKTWKARQGLGLNKFSIDGATPVPVINQPDSVTEQGDALSAGNLNDLEDRIYDAFDDIADGTQIVGKATADASGNVITTTYETKADASDLKSAIQANSNRISNLEENLDPTGAYKTVNYRGTNAVPTGKAKYGLVEDIVGKSRAWNNVANPANNNSAVVGAGEINGITITYNPSTEKYHVSGTASGNYDRSLMNSIIPTNDHKYLIYSNEIPTGQSGNIRLYIYGTGVFGGLFNGTIAKANSSGSANVYLYIADGTNVNFDFQFVLRDMTTILNDWADADITTANIPLMVKQIPDLLKYDAFGYSLVDTVVEGVKSVGVNIWDEEWEVGTISTTTGEDTKNNNTIRSEGYIPVTPSTNYSPYVNGMPMYHIGIFYYDYNKNFISFGNPNNTTKLFQTPSGCFYIRFACSVTYGSTYNHNIAIAKSDTALTQYYPYMTDTLSLPTSVTLRSAGTVADTDELNVEVNGVQKRRQTSRIGSYTFTGDESWTTYSGTSKRTDITGLGAKSIGASDIPNIENDMGLVATSRTAIGSSGGITVSVTTIIISNDSVSLAVAGKKINFELDSYVETLLDPIENNTILTEGGGTINTIQTQTTKIDNCLDVGYLAL